YPADDREEPAGAAQNASALIPFAPASGKPAAWSNKASRDAGPRAGVSFRASSTPQTRREGVPALPGRLFFFSEEFFLWVRGELCAGRFERIGVLRAGFEKELDADSGQAVGQRIGANDFR